MSKYFIVRNRNNSLRAFQSKPAKTRFGFWESIDGYFSKIKDNWFPEVKWEDKEPKVLIIEESPWIKVEDRLPKQRVKVFIICRNKVSKEITHIASELIHEEWQHISNKYWDVIAWMPIPEFKE